MASPLNKHVGRQGGEVVVLQSEPLQTGEWRENVRREIDQAVVGKIQFFQIAEDSEDARR